MSHVQRFSIPWLDRWSQQLTSQAAAFVKRSFSLSQAETSYTLGWCVVVERGKPRENHPFVVRFPPARSAKGLQVHAVSGETSFDGWVGWGWVLA